MKTNILSFAVLVAYLVSHTAGNVILNSFPDVVYLGETYKLTWTATADYAYQILLIRLTPNKGNQQGYEQILDLADNLVFDTLQGSYDWTVQSNLTVQSDYALWLMGMVTPYNGRGYPNQTSTFSISSSSSSHSGSGISGGVIAGVVVGGLVLLALIAGGVVFCIWRKRRSAASRRQAGIRATRLESVVKESYPGYEMDGRSP